MFRKTSYKIITLRQRNKIDINILKFIHKKNCFKISLSNTFIYFTYIYIIFIYYFWNQYFNHKLLPVFFQFLSAFMVPTGSPNLPITISYNLLSWHLKKTLYFFSSSIILGTVCYYFYNLDL